MISYFYSITSLPLLHTLRLSNNLLDGQPSYNDDVPLYDLKHLSSLDLSRCLLKTIPYRSVSLCSPFLTFRFNHQGIFIPIEVTTSYNLLSVISLINLTWLKELSLAYNVQLGTNASLLNDQLCSLTSLTKLNLAGCRLKEIPDR